MDLILTIAIIAGVILLISLLGNMLLMMILMWTPAWKFFVAKLQSKPIWRLHSKTNFFDFAVGTKPQANLSWIKGLGPFSCEPGSGMIERKSKIEMYDALYDNARSFRLDTAAIIHEIRAIGIKISRYKEWDVIRKVANDKQWAKAQYDKLAANSIERAEKFKVFVRQVRAAVINIPLHKAYKFNELYNLFPDDFNPVDSEKACDLAVANYKKKNQQAMVWAGYALAFVVVLIGGAIAYMMISGQKQPEMVVKITSDMLANATQTMKG